MSFDLALVTGASSGIGYAMSKRLDQEGIAQIVVGRNGDALEELAASCTVPVTPLVADLSTEEGVSLVSQVIRNRAPDLLINNAGMGLYGEITDLSVASQKELLRLNSESVMVLTVEAVHTLQQEKRKGCILNISSAAAYLPFPCFAAYAASKAFVNSFTESVAAELVGSGIDVLLACPGQVDTAFRERAAQGADSGKGKGLAMTVEFAVATLWQQIQTRRQVSIFGPSYRLAIWVCRNLLPKSLVARILKKSIKQRI